MLIKGWLSAGGGTVLPHSQNESQARWKEFIPHPKTGLGLFEIMVLPNIKNYHIFYAANLKNQPSFWYGCMVPPKHQWFAKRPLKNVLVAIHLYKLPLSSFSWSFYESPCSLDPSKTYSVLFVVCVALLLPLSLLSEYCSCFIKIIYSQSTSTQPLPTYRCHILIDHLIKDQ